MRCVSSATCTLVEPVSVLLAPCFLTISCLASFVRLMSPPGRQSQQSAGSRRKAAAAVAGQGSNLLLEQELADAPLRDQQPKRAQGNEIGDVNDLVPANHPQVECSQELDGVVEG